jgi:hypothetical protein
MRQLALGMIVVLLGSGPTVAGVCESDKLKAAGTKTVKMAACHAKAVGKAIAVDPTCLAEADAKFSKDITKAEAKGSCDVDGNGDALQSSIDAFIADLGIKLPGPGPSKCVASKWKATATKVKVKLGCHAKAEAKSRSVDSACLAKAELKFVASFAKADAKGSCTGDAAAIETDVDASLDDLHAALVSCSKPGTPTGTRCDDGIGCTDGDFCLNGVCEKGAPDCDPSLDVCTPSACDFDTGACTPTPVVCQPHVRPECFIRFCDPLQEGYCNSTPDPNADPALMCPANECENDADCSDGNPCTIDECRGQSSEKFCVWTLNQCDDGRSCTADLCHVAGGCMNVLENPSTSCDDGHACTDDHYADYPATCDCVHTPRDDCP